MINGAATPSSRMRFPQLRERRERRIPFIRSPAQSNRTRDRAPLGDVRFVLVRNRTGFEHDAETLAVAGKPRLSCSEVKISYASAQNSENRIDSGAGALHVARSGWTLSSVG